MVATTGMTFISAMQTTRTMSCQWYLKASRIGALGTAPCWPSAANAGVAANDVAREDDEGAQQEWHAPTPCVERLGGQVIGQRQEDRRGEYLPCLHALGGETGVIAAPAEWSVLENHRAGA